MLKTLATIKIISLVLFAAMLFTGCANRNIDISYSVNLTPLVDSLPCRATIEYTTWTSKETIDFEGLHWATIQKSRIDTYVELKASGITNVKSIQIGLGGYRNQPVLRHCDDVNCSVEARYDLYGD